jgi:hypothetical protein
MVRSIIRACHARVGEDRRQQREAVTRIGHQRRGPATIARAPEQRNVEIDVIGRLPGRRQPVPIVVEARAARRAEHEDLAAQLGRQECPDLGGGETQPGDVLGDRVGADRETYRLA